MGGGRDGCSQGGFWGFCGGSGCSSGGCRKRCSMRGAGERPPCSTVSSRSTCGSRIVSLTVTSGEWRRTCQAREQPACPGMPSSNDPEPYRPAPRSGCGRPLSRSSEHRRTVPAHRPIRAKRGIDRRAAAREQLCHRMIGSPEQGDCACQLGAVRAGHGGVRDGLSRNRGSGPPGMRPAQGAPFPHRGRTRCA